MQDHKIYQCDHRVCIDNDFFLEGTKRNHDYTWCVEAIMIEVFHRV